MLVEKTSSKLREFFNSGIWTEMLGIKVAEIEDYHRKEAEWLRHYVVDNGYRKVLDIGCGTGESIAPLSDLDISIVGVDIAENQLSIARSRFNSNPRIELLNYDASQLPEAWTDSFDLAYCIGAGFGNLEDLQLLVLKNMLRVTKKEGSVVLSVYSERARKAQREWYTKQGLEIQDVNDYVTFLKTGIVSERFTKEKLHHLGEMVNARVEIIELTPIAYMAIFHQKV